MKPSERLAEARLHKLRRAKALRALKAGDVSLTYVLNELPDDYRTIEIWHILRHTKRFGDRGARRTLMRAKVWPLERLGNLTEIDLRRIRRNLPIRAMKTRKKRVIS